MNQTTKQIELLAPAGGWPQLRAAVRFGANAVYLACNHFGMRAQAANFKLDEMPSVVEFAHNAGVKVYVTLNTLMKDSDITLLPAYLDALDAAGVDAFIVSDMGAFSLAKRRAPRVDIHISTQASVMNAEAACMWYELGASRIVCAREMSLSDIAELRSHVPDDLGIEAFVHGAMCMAYSGRCLLSSAMTGRRANEGLCAQSCRWNYALVEQTRPGQYFEIEEDAAGSYILNAQDLNMVSHLDELAAAGVDSFKIEGRNKKAFYVASVVGAYRSVLDGGAPELAEAELLTISHRPYSTGFYYGRAEQTLETSSYEFECIHVATVEACEPANGDSWKVSVFCHNRFEPGDSLGVVSPYMQSYDVGVMGPLSRFVPKDGGKPFAERDIADFEEIRAQATEVPVEIANRAKEHYSFFTTYELHPGDYLRKRVNKQ